MRTIHSRVWSIALASLLVAASGGWAAADPAEAPVDRTPVVAEAAGPEVEAPQIPPANPEADQPLWDDETEAKAPAPKGVVGADVPNMGGVLTKLGGTMVLLVALLVGGLWVIQRFSRRGLQLGSKDKPLRVIDRQALGPKKSVCLLNACGRYLVLGVSDKEISVLTEVFPSEADGASPVEAKGKVTEGPVSFSEQLIEAGAPVGASASE